MLTKYKQQIKKMGIALAFFSLQIVYAENSTRPPSYGCDFLEIQTKSGTTIDSVLMASGRVGEIRNNSSYVELIQNGQYFHEIRGQIIFQKTIPGKVCRALVWVEQGFCLFEAGLLKFSPRNPDQFMPGVVLIQPYYVWNQTNTSGKVNNVDLKCTPN